MSMIMGVIRSSDVMRDYLSTPGRVLTAFPATDNVIGRLAGACVGMMPIQPAACPALNAGSVARWPAGRVFCAGTGGGGG
jgi:hypothetical protein